jgi:hypothetical protein
MKIGAVWYKATEGGKMFLSVKIDEAALPLTIDETKFITLWEIPEDQRGNENSPHFTVSLSKKSTEEK